jgi:CheY-like chemotaxis protein
LPGGAETILLVEDNPSVRRIAHRVLLDLGYRVHEAPDAAAALAVIDRGEPVDLLFTDIIMPGGLTGPALAAEVRKRRPDLPVVFTSGYAGSAMTNGNGAMPAGSVLTKPYRRQDLAARIRDALDGPSP